MLNRLAFSQLHEEHQLLIVEALRAYMHLQAERSVAAPSEITSIQHDIQARRANDLLEYLNPKSPGTMRDRKAPSSGYMDSAYGQVQIAQRQYTK